MHIGLGLQRTIDILKIDVEEAEWKALPQIFASKAAWFARGRVRQLLMEVRFFSSSVFLAVTHLIYSSNDTLNRFSE